MKWCSYCRKDDHNDSECWSTRAMPTGAVAVDYTKISHGFAFSGQRLLKTYTKAELDAAVASERGRWIAALLDSATHVYENAAALRKYPGMELEARAREMGACYLREAAHYAQASATLGAMRERLEALTPNV